MILSCLNAPCVPRPYIYLPEPLPADLLVIFNLASQNFMSSGLCQSLDCAIPSGLYYHPEEQGCVMFSYHLTPNTSLAESKEAWLPIKPSFKAMCFFIYRPLHIFWPEGMTKTHVIKKCWKMCTLTKCIWILAVLMLAGQVQGPMWSPKEPAKKVLDFA